MRKVMCVCALSVFLIVVGNLSIGGQPTAHNVMQTTDHAQALIRMAGGNACNPRLAVCKS